MCLSHLSFLISQGPVTFFAGLAFRLRQQTRKVIITRPRGYTTFFMLYSVEHEFFLLINVKMPTVVGILTFMSRKNSILGVYDPKKS